MLINQVQEAYNLLLQDCLVVDVRSLKDFASSHFWSARHYLGNTDLTEWKQQIVDEFGTPEQNNYVIIMTDTSFNGQQVQEYFEKMCRVVSVKFSEFQSAYPFLFPPPLG